MSKASTAHVCPNCGTMLQQSLELSLDKAIARFKHDFILAQMAAHGGNMSEVARAIDVNRSTVFRILKRLGRKSGRRGGRPPHELKAAA